MAETIKKKKKNEPDGFDRFNRVSNTANVLLNVMFLLMALVCIIPVLLVIAISLSAEASITEYGYHLIPKIVSFEGYEYLAKQSTLIIRALGVSLFVTIVGTVLGILLTTERVPDNGGIHPHGIQRRPCIHLFYHFSVFKSEGFGMGAYIASGGIILQCSYMQNLF